MIDAIFTKEADIDAGVNFAVSAIDFQRLTGAERYWYSFHEGRRMAYQGDLPLY